MVSNLTQRELDGLFWKRRVMVVVVVRPPSTRARAHVRRTSLRGTILPLTENPKRGANLTPKTRVPHTSKSVVVSDYIVEPILD